MKIDIRFSVTEAAATELKKIFFSKFVRVSARPSGCSKTIYGLGTSETCAPDDISEEISGINFIVDRRSILRLDGVNLDWISSEGQEGFLFSEINTPEKCSSDGKCCRKGGCS